MNFNNQLNDIDSVWTSYGQLTTGSQMMLIHSSWVESRCQSPIRLTQPVGESLRNQLSW